MAYLKHHPPLLRSFVLFLVFLSFFVVPLLVCFPSLCFPFVSLDSTEQTLQLDNHKQLCKLILYANSHGNRSTSKILPIHLLKFSSFLINPSCDSSNFEKFIKMFTTSCLLIILTNQNIISF